MIKQRLVLLLIVLCQFANGQDINSIKDTASGKPLMIYSLEKATAFKINHLSGFYKAPIEIKITGLDTSNARIIVSNEKGETYPGVNFTLSETSSLTIIVKGEKGQEQKFLGTYFINSPHQLPIVSIIVDSIDFFPPEGIYNGEVANRAEKKKNKKAKTKVVGKAWDKKPISCFAQFYFFNELIDELALDVKTYGGMTLGWKEKSLQLSARDNKYERGKIKVKLFQNLPFRDYQHVVLRTSGNDQHSTRIKDISISQVAADIDLNIKDYRQVILYVNGIYYGIHNLREKINSDYFKYRYNWKKGDFIELQGSGEENSEYNSFVSYVVSSSGSPDFINLIKDSIDIENYFNYQIFETYITNIDSRGNVRFYKHKDGKWKWVVYDADQACAYAESNFIKNRCLPEERLWYNPTYTTTILEHLLKNDTLRNRFVTQYCYLNATYLNAGSFGRSLDLRAEKIKEELPRHFNRRKNLYKEDMESWAIKLSDLKKYFFDRDSSLFNDLKNTFSLDSVCRLTVRQNLNFFKVLTVNNSVVHASSIDGYFFTNVPFELSVVNANHQYQFNGWSDGIKTSNRNIQLSSDLTLTANFSHLKASAKKDSIEIRKYYINNSKKEPLLFIELNNTRNRSVSLKGVKLYEDRSGLSYDLSDVIIPAASSVLLTNNLNLFNSYVQNKNLKPFLAFENSSFLDDVKFNLIDTINHTWIDSLHYIVTDSMLILHAGYLIEKINGKISIKNLSLLKLKQLKFGTSVKKEKSLDKIIYMVVIISGVLIVLIAMFIIRRRKNKITQLPIIILFSILASSCNGQINEEEGSKLVADTIKSNCEKGNSVLKRFIDNSGKGDSSMLGTRNVRAVFPGLLYRGGGNNLELKDSIPKYYVQNPLPYYAIDNLHGAGFNKIYYLYSKNFTQRYESSKIDSLKSIGLEYDCRPVISDTFLIEFYADLLDRVNNNIDNEEEKVYIHCWNGWHQSGMLSALSLMQFCDFNSIQALKYWELCTENNYKGYNNVRMRIKEYKPLQGYEFSSTQKKMLCPCMTELDTAHVGKPIVAPKDSLTLSNNEMMEKRHGVYVVKLGDNLYAISRKLGVDFHELKKKNKLKSNIVHVGQELKY
jgi:hypothetical protein